MMATKHFFSFFFTLFVFANPWDCYSQEFENKILEINDILSTSKYRSITMGSNTEYSYEFNLNHESNLVLKENLLQGSRLQTKSYIFTSTEMMTCSPKISVDKKYLTLQFASMNYGASAVYIKYEQISNQGYRSSGQESSIYLYYDHLNDYEAKGLASSIKDLFELFLSIDPDVYYEPIIVTTQQPVYKSPTITQPSVNTNQREYYNREKKRVYAFSDAAYYRTVNYDSYGKPTGLVECYFVSGELYFKGRLYDTDRQDLENDEYAGQCTWYFKNGNKEREGFYRYGESHGTFNYYYENGEKEAEVSFADGILNGPFIIYYENGVEKFKGEYIDGALKDDKHIECDEDGICESVFVDDFNDNDNGWPESDNENIYSSLEDGFYLIKSLDGTSFRRTINYYLDQDGAFIVNAQFYFLQGTDEYGHGLIWGYRNSENYNCFEISSDGYFCIKAYFDGIELELAKWTKSSNIRQGQAWNKLQINKYGEKIYFIINGKIVHSDEFKGLRGNHLGIICRGQKSFYVDDFTIREYILEGDGKWDRGNRRSDAWAGNGTGVIISTDGYILTNYHVVSEAEEISVELYKNGIRNAYKAIVKAYDEDVDLAVLRIDDPTFQPFYYIPFTINFSQVDVGTRVYALGYPMSSIIGDEIRFNEGTISSESGFQGDISTYQVSVPLQPGNSGSPLFDYNGNLVGIVSSKIMAADNISYAIKSKYIRGLLSNLYPKPQLSNYNNLDGAELTYQIRTLKEYVPIIRVR